MERGKQILEPARFTKGVAKRWKENEKRSNREKQEPLVVTEERPGTGISLLPPPLPPLAAKQSVKARFLYYRRLIGFLKVKCTSASSLPLPLPLNPRDEDVGRAEDDAGRRERSRTWRGEKVARLA